jgi:hypothetical protein
MILRRITKHVKDQNWFAVALDFFIVVAGILIAFQITNWNEGRALKQRTNTLIERLETDFGSDVWVAISLHNYHKQVYADALLVLNDITGREPLSDEAFLISAYRATQFNRFSQTTGIYEELVSTGGLELVASTKMGATASLFYGSNTISDYERFGQSSEYRNLYRSIMPINIQLVVDSVCGDRALTIDQLINEENSIGYECALDLPPEQIEKAAQVLRQHPSIAPALRHRVATLKTQNSNFENIIQRIWPFRATRKVLEKSSQINIWNEE